LATRPATAPTRSATTDTIPHHGSAEEGSLVLGEGSDWSSIRKLEAIPSSCVFDVRNLSDVSSKVRVKVLELPSAIAMIAVMFVPRLV
jgi:hypothetical protein